MHGTSMISHGGRLPPAYCKGAQAYDRDTAAFQEYRRMTVDALPLRVGDVVLDVGCGTGLCFAEILDKVGDSGRVIGIDASADMLAVARRRTADHGWSNVSLVESAARDARIPVTADAAVFCAVHDILRSPPALHHVIDGLRPGAWVAAGGGKWAAPWMVAVNVHVFLLHRPYVSSFEGFLEPWSHLEDLLEDIRVTESAFGAGYVAVGRVPDRAGRSTRVTPSR